MITTAVTAVPTAAGLTVFMAGVTIYLLCIALRRTKRVAGGRKA